MKTDQTVTLVFSFLGLLLGFFSNLISHLMLAILIPLIVYIAVLYYFIKRSKVKKKRPIITNSIISYFLLWLIVWIFLFNL